MADNKTSIIISAVDQTEGALKNINNNLGQLEGQFNRLSGVVSGFAAVAGVTAFTGLVKGAIDTADKLYDVSQQTGASVEALSAMSGAAKLAGVDMQTVAGGLTKLSKNMLDAANGSGDAAKVFQALGISVKDTNGNLKSSDAVMMEFAKGLQTVSSGSERAAAAQMVFGKSGAQLVPLLADLAQKGTLQAKITTEQARAANELNDTLEILGRKSTAWATIVAADVVPSMQAFANVLLEVKTSADGTKTAVGNLSKDGSISSWANDTAVFLAHVVDELRLIGKIAIEIATPIERVAKNIYNVGALAGIAFSSSSFAEKKAAFDQLKKESEAYYAGLDKRLANNRAASPLFADRVKDEIANLEKLKRETENIRKIYLDAGYSIDVANAAARRFRRASNGEDWGEETKSLINLETEANKAAKALENLRIDQMKLVTKQAVAELDALAKAEADYYAALQKASDPLRQQASELEQQVEFYGKTDAEIQNTIVSRLEEAKAIAEQNGAYPEHLKFLQDEIDARKRIGSAASQKDFLDANKKAAESAAREWEKFSDDLNRSLTDSLFRAFESGGSFAENFAKALGNSLKAAISKALIQAAITTGSNALNGLINVVAGNPSSGTGSTNYLGLASNANSIYNLASGGYTAMAGNGISAVGNLAGSTYVSAYGAGVAAGTEATSAAAAVYYQAMVDAAVAGNAELAASYAATYNGLTAGGSAAGSASGMAGAATGVLAILAGMYMSGEAWQSGYKENGRWTDPSKPQTYELALRDIEFEINKTLFGKDFAESKLLAVLTGSSLQKQMTEAVQGWIFGRERMLGSSIKGTFSDSGFSDGQLGINMKKSGGWFSSSKEWTDWQALPEGVDKVLQSMYFTTKASFQKIADVVSDTSFTEKLKSFVYDYQTAAKAGESTTVDFGQLLAEASVSLAESMGNYLLPSIEGLRQTTAVNGQQITETWGQALARVTQETSAVSGVLDAMGKSLSEAFGANNANNVLAMSDAMVKLFGGIEGLTNAFNAYYENFYTSTEKTARSWELMQRQFDALDLSMPKTRNEFRMLVDSLDLNTTAGQQAFSSLMNLQAGFAALTPEITSFSAVLSSALSDAKGAVNNALEGVRNAVEAQKKKIADSYETSISPLTSRIESLSALIDALGSGGNLAAQSESTLMAQRAAALQTLQQAASVGLAGGSVAGIVDQISQSISVLSKPSEQLYGSFVEYARAQGQASAATESLRGIAIDQKSVAEMTLDAMQKSYEAQIANLDATLAAAQAQVDAINGVNSSVMSLSSALASLAAAVSQQKTIQDAMAQPSGAVNEKTIAALYVTMLGRQADQPGLDWWLKNSAGSTMDELIKRFRAGAFANGEIPKFAAGGYYGGGLAIVGEEGPEIINFRSPAQIYNASQTYGILSGKDSVEEIAALRAEQKSQAAAFAAFMARMTKVLEKWDGDGMPEQRVIV